MQEKFVAKRWNLLIEYSSSDERNFKDRPSSAEDLASLFLFPLVFFHSSVLSSFFLPVRDPSVVIAPRLLKL